MITGQSSYQEIRYLYLHRTFVAVQMFQRRMRRGVREREREYPRTFCKSTKERKKSYTVTESLAFCFNKFKINMQWGSE